MQIDQQTITELKQQQFQQKLKIFTKMQKTVQIQYQILKTILINLNNESIFTSNTLVNLYTNLSEDIKSSFLYQYISYKLWLNDSVSSILRQKTRFFMIVFDWILKFQLRVGKLNTYKAQFDLITEFIKNQTKTIFQRVILLQQVNDDLKQLIVGQFWLQSQNNGIIEYIQKNKLQQLDQQNATSIINFLKQVISYGAITIKQSQNIYVDRMLLIVSVQNYNQFILKCIRLLLTSSNYDISTQMQLSKLILIFLHRDLPPKQVVSIVKILMVRTSKPVRFALIVQYVQLYQFLEKSGNYTVLDQLENIVYFRQLIIGKRQVQQANIIKHNLNSVEKQIIIKARTKQRIYFSNENIQQSLLRLQFYIENGDINLKIIYNTKQGKQLTYWQQLKTTDKRIQIILKYQGLYCLQLDNAYSWINSKKIIYKMDQFIKIKKNDNQ